MPGRDVSAPLNILIALVAALLILTLWLGTRES